MDPDNPIVRLCVKGMEHEQNGQFAAAASHFMKAWEQSTDDLEACIAAHYVARHQQSPTDVLHWNQESLDRAMAVNDESVREFYPSLYLNLAKAHEDLGNVAEAARFYGLAASCLGSLAPGYYAGHVRDGVARGLQRVS